MANIMDAKSSLTVKKMSSYAISPLEQLEEIAFFEGSSNPVTYRRNFKNTYSCNFELYLYPFDTQVRRKKFLGPSSLEGGD